MAGCLLLDEQAINGGLSIRLLWVVVGVNKRFCMQRREGDLVMLWSGCCGLSVAIVSSISSSHGSDLSDRMDEYGILRGQHQRDSCVEGRSMTSDVC